MCHIYLFLWIQALNYKYKKNSSLKKKTHNYHDHYHPLQILTIWFSFYDIIFLKKILILNLKQVKTLKNEEAQKNENWTAKSYIKYQLHNSMHTS